MKRGKLYSISYLVGSVVLIAGIGAWNFYASRRHMLQTHDVWVDRVSTRIMADRLSMSRTLEPLAGMSNKAIQHELFARPDFAGAYWFDVKSHEFERWVKPEFSRILKAPDPRLVVAQLHATESHAPELGPVLLLEGSLFATAAVPVDKLHALVVIEESTDIKKILEQESSWQHLRAFVYDSEEHPIFLGANAATVKQAVPDVLTKSAAGAKSGLISLPGWTSVATFHTAPSLDWVYIVIEKSVGTFYPVLLYIGSLICLLWLAKQPLKAADGIRRARERAELRQFALHVDNFVHGKELSLSEPPYPFSELLPIVTVMRWLLPQWKKAEAFPQELGLERKLLSLLIESLPEGILFFNAQGNLQLGNELGKVFLALQQEPSREFKMINGTLIPRGFLEPYAEPVFTGQQINLGKEVEVAWADGKHMYRVWVESVQVEEKVEGFIVVVRDVTFRRQWDYVQEQVLSGITHDLRGPLSAIMGYLDLLRRQLKEGPPKAVEYVGLAREAGTRLTQMISDILDVVRFEQGKIEMDVQAISVQDMFERMTNIFGVTAGQKNVHLKIVNDQKDTTVTGDRKLLERILDNLVGNAIKFTPAAGTITVQAQREDKRTVFSIKDTGRGIPKEAQSRIFDKFQQVRPGDRSTGYGLGLAVVKFIVEAHKGEIRLESEVDKGSTFTFWIPDQPITAKAEPSPEASPGEPAHS